jgi:nucleoside-diphosphate-sugar epimerase
VINKSIGVIGASSLVGLNLLPMLGASGCQVVAYSRHNHKNLDSAIEWRQLNSVCPHPLEGTIADWVCTAPIWVLPDYFYLLKIHKVKRIVVLSSTSRFTKESSADIYEQTVVRKLIDAETTIQNWAEENNVDWVILRPTMIYGFSKDKNVAEISRIIQRWGFFPLLGKGRGLRQPVHVDDVAKACKAAITLPDVKNKAYNLSGGETLTYKEMVARVFIALGKKPYFLHLPRVIFYTALSILRLIPRFRHWRVEMAERMDKNLIFDHTEASIELGFSPRPFRVGDEEIL